MCGAQELLVHPYRGMALWSPVDTCNLWNVPERFESPWWQARHGVQHHHPALVAPQGQGDAERGADAQQARHGGQRVADRINLGEIHLDNKYMRTKKKHNTATQNNTQQQRVSTSEAC